MPGRETATLRKRERARPGQALGRLLLLCLLLAPCHAAARNPQGERLSAAEIEAVLAGNSLVGYWQNAELRQHFAPDGTAVRQRERRALVRGHWRTDVGRDLLCTDYPTVHETTCFEVYRRAGKLVLFEDGTGYPLHGTLLEGNVLAGLGSAGEEARTAGDRPPGPVRTYLTRDELFAENPVEAHPVHNGYFMPVGKAGPARHRLNGRLSVPGFALQGRLELGRGYEWFPAFEVDVVSYGDLLLPANTGLIMPSKPEAALALILSPGRVWSEPGDGGLSRASFPFVLVSTTGDALHNGIASFLFDDDSVSALRVQLVQETAPGFKLDAWGQGPMRYTPGTLGDPGALIRHFEHARKARTPIRPWSDLAARYGADALAGFETGTLGDDLSVAGLIVDGTAYVLPCRTRYGDYPYCEEMRQGASTMTQSLAALPALLHLAQKYGAWVLDLRLANYVKVTAAHDGWSRVSFENALDMASGIGDRAPPALLSTEQYDLRRSYQVPSLRQKLDWIFRDPDNPAKPGEAFRFRPGDSLVLAAAMDAFVKHEEGPKAGIWALTSREVLRPIGIDRLPLMHSIEPAGGPGVPALHTGLYPTIDDVAKIARLLQERGRHAGRQLLLAAPLDALMDWRRERGLATGVAGRRYLHGFWLWPFVRGACRLWLPVASGSGGQLVMLLPNGMAAFRFADDRRLPVEAMAAVADRLRPFCP